VANGGNAAQAAMPLATNTAYALAAITTSTTLTGYENASGTPYTATGSGSQGLNGTTLGGRYNLTQPWLGTVAAFAGMAGAASTAQVSAWFRYYASLCGQTWS
jgi:hypothetical protein